MKNLTPIILIIVSFGLFLLFINPQYEKVKELKKVIEKNNESIELANDLRSKRENLQQEFNQISPEKRQKLEKILPDTVDNVRLILDINNIADESGISITNIGIVGDDDKTKSNTNKDGTIVDKTDNSYGTLGLSFSVTSRYDIFKKFMQSLENSLRLVDIESFSVSANSEGSFYDFNVTLKTYWLR